MYITETKRTQLKMEDLISILSSNLMNVKMKQLREENLEIFSLLIKNYRYDLMQTFMGYKIILNGNRAFKNITLDNGNILNRVVVFDRLRELERKFTDIEITL